MDKHLKGIIFDWGNVLGLFSHEKVHRKLAEHCPLSQREFYIEVRQQLQLTLSYEEFLSVWRSCILGDNPEIGDVLRRLDPLVPICILSNTDPIHWEAVGALPVVRRFFNERRIVRS